MNILITGSAGFIGTHLMKALKTRTTHRTLGVDKKFGVDITNFTKLSVVTMRLLGRPDLIIHLAAQTSQIQSFDNPVDTFSSNALGTFNICELARLFKVKVIYTSSRKAEPNALGSYSPYGLSKKMGEDWLKEYVLDYGVEAIINRLGNVYGPGQHGSNEAHWLSWFIQASLTKQPITIYGFEGKQSRDMLYVDDLVDLILDQIDNFDLYSGRGNLIMDENPPVYKVSGGKENEISLMRALELLDYKNYTFGKVASYDREREVYDIGRICGVNGWQPKVSVVKGIEKTMASYLKKV